MDRIYQNVQGLLLLLLLPRGIESRERERERGREREREKRDPGSLLVEGELIKECFPGKWGSLVERITP